ncbi:ORF6N domain-containing protein [Ligilactobacillus animalis]|uniref:ORF6N domain-containing protein n=1 Tax=Ligilactobacillus animalis TaxID=1605 RepID=UPI00241C2904|nr:ORF6C domain-containing protein [Ligilactobacillus animalis]
MNKLKQVEYDNQIILTTEQLATFYGTTERAIKQNFNNNYDKFQEGLHYYFLKGVQLKEFKNRVENFDLVGKRANALYLWTKRGASRHAKMLGTDRAWDVYDELEENYFNPKTQQRLPQSPTEMLKLAVASTLETADKVEKLTTRMDDLEQNASIDPGEYNYLSKRISSEVQNYITAHHLNLNNKQRAQLYKDINRGVKEVTGVKTRSQLRKKDFDTVDRYLMDWVPSSATLMIIEKIGDEAKGQERLF